MNSERWRDAQAAELAWWRKVVAEATAPAAVQARREAAGTLEALFAPYLALRRDSRVLEIGGGRTPVAPYLSAGAVLGCDPLYGELARPDVGYHAGFPCVAGQGEALPFRDGACDLVLFLNAIDHCDRPAATLDEIARVLTPGGLMVLTVNCMVGTPSLATDLLLRHVIRPPSKAFYYRAHPHVFSATGMTRLVGRRFDVLDRRIGPIEEEARIRPAWDRVARPVLRRRGQLSLVARKRA